MKLVYFQFFFCCTFIFIQFRRNGSSLLNSLVVRQSYSSSLYPKKKDVRILKHPRIEGEYVLMKMWCLTSLGFHSILLFIIICCYFNFIIIKLRQVHKQLLVSLSTLGRFSHKTYMLSNESKF